MLLSLWSQQVFLDDIQNNNLNHEWFTVIIYIKYNAYVKSHSKEESLMALKNGETMELFE